jgi:WD40 repeat protein
MKALSNMDFDNESTIRGSIDESEIGEARPLLNPTGSAVSSRPTAMSPVKKKNTDALENEAFQRSIQGKRLVLALTKIQQKLYADALKLLETFLENAEVEINTPPHELIEAQMSVVYICTLPGQNNYKAANKILPKLLESEIVSETPYMHATVEYYWACVYKNQGRVADALPHALKACEERHNLEKDRLYFEACALAAELHIKLNNKLEAELYIDEIPVDQLPEVLDSDTINKWSATSSVPSHPALARHHSRKTTAATTTAGSPSIAMINYSQDAPVRCIAVTPNLPGSYHDSMVALGLESGLIRVFSLSTYPDYHKTVEYLTGLTSHKGAIVSLDFASSGNKFASASSDSTLIIWEVLLHATDPKKRFSALRELRLEQDLGPLVWTPDTTLYPLAVCQGEYVKLWGTYNGEPEALKYAPRQTAANANDSVITKFWNTLGGASEKEVERKRKAEMKRKQDFCVRSVRWIKSGKVAAWTSDNRIVVRSTYGHLEKMEFIEQLPDAGALAVHPNGFLMTISVTGEIKVFDTMSYRISEKPLRITQIKAQTRLAKALFAPNGRSVATMNERDNKIMVWDAYHGTLLQSIEERTDLKGQPVSFAFDRSDLLAVGLHNGEVEMVEMQNRPTYDVVYTNN